MLRQGGVVLAVIALGCATPTEPHIGVLTRPDVSAWVTPDIAAALDTGGHFLFSLPSADTTWARVDRSQVEAFARAFLRTYLVAGGTAPSVSEGGLDIVPLRAAIERIHGEAIDWQRVTLAPWEPFYARTPVAPVAPNLPAYVRRALGPRFHVLLLYGRSAVADLVVSRDLTEVSLGADSVSFKSGLPSEIVWVEGLPVSLGDHVPLIPEAAVRDVAQRTGAKVDVVPSLIGPWDRLSPVFARWAIHLDRPITVVGDSTGVPMITREILVGLGPTRVGPATLRWFVASPDQPTSDQWPFVSPTDGRRDAVTVQFVSGAPVRVVPVHP